MLSLSPLMHRDEVMWAYSDTVALYKKREEVSEWNLPAGTLILKFPVSRTVRNFNCLNYLISGIFLCMPAWADYTSTCLVVQIFLILILSLSLLGLSHRLPKNKQTNKTVLVHSYRICSIVKYWHNKMVFARSWEEGWMRNNFLE